MKPISRRLRADADVEAPVDYYAAESQTLALRFIDSLARAYGQIARNPGIGSSRYGEALRIVGLRHWRCGEFPHLVFYVERPDDIDVWRVLDGARDLPVSLRDEDLR